MRFRAPTPTSHSFRISPRMSYIISPRKNGASHPRHPFYPPTVIHVPVRPGTPRAAHEAAKAATAAAVQEPWWEPYFVAVGDKFEPIPEPDTRTPFDRLLAFILVCATFLASLPSVLVTWFATVGDVPGAVPMRPHEDKLECICGECVCAKAKTKAKGKARAKPDSDLSSDDTDGSGCSLDTEPASCSSIEDWVARHAIPAGAAARAEREEMKRARRAKQAARKDARMRRFAAEKDYEVVDHLDPYVDDEYARTQAKVQATAQCESTLALMWCVHLLEQLVGSWCPVVTGAAVLPMLASLFTSAFTFVCTFSRRFRAKYAASSLRFLSDLLVVGWVVRVADQWVKDMGKGSGKWKGEAWDKDEKGDEFEVSSVSSASS